MATLLLLVIYIAFIGLGIPDSLFGTAWPAIYPELGLPVSAASCVTLLISGGTIISSFFSARVLNRFGTAKVTAFSTALTAAALFGFSVSGSLFWLCLFAIPLGIGAGAIDSGLNNYVALHYRATHMNFLHCFYGVGVSLSPYLMSFTLSGTDGWRGGYRTVFYIQLAIAGITLISLPLWKRAESQLADNRAETESIPPQTLKFIQICKIPAAKWASLVLLSSCAIEYICGSWGSTFLVNAKGMPVDRAAEVITLYYVGMTLGRFLSGILANKLSSWQLIQIGQGIVFAAILLLLLPLANMMAAVGLFLIGLGNGPAFPNLLHLTPKNFGRDISQSVMGFQMVSAYIGIMAMPLIFGFLVQAFDAVIFPYFLLAIFVMLIIAMVFLIKRLKKEGRYEQQR